MATDGREYVGGGVLRDAFGRKQMRAVVKHEEPDGTDLYQGAIGITNQDGVEEVVFEQVTSIELRVPFLNAKDPEYGAIGDGTYHPLSERYDTLAAAQTFYPAATALTNSIDWAAIQKALTAASGLECGTYVPAGRYYLTARLDLPSGGHLFGESAELTVFLTHDGWTGAAIRSDGSIGSNVNTSGSHGTGDVDITTATAHGLAVNDWARIIGQRDAFNVTDNGQYWLGDDDGGTEYVYFAEYIQARAVASTTDFTSRAPLVYPDYLDTNAGETSAHKRSRSTIAKVTFSVKPIVEKIGFEVQGAPGTTEAIIQFNYALKGRVRDVDFDMGEYPGFLVHFQNSHKCVGLRCTYDRVVPDPQIGSNSNYNSFKSISSQQCFFRNCEGAGGYQPVDFTYFPTAGGMATLYGGAIGCHFTEMFDAGVTTHHGTYGCKIHFNVIANGDPVGGRGAYVRGAKHSVRGNEWNNLSHGASIANVRGCDVVSNSGEGLVNGILLGQNQSSVHDAFLADNVLWAQTVDVGNAIWGFDDAVDIARVRVASGTVHNFHKGMHIGSPADEWTVEQLHTPGCTTPIVNNSAASNHRFVENRPSGAPVQVEEVWRKIEFKGGQLDALSSDRVLLPDAQVAASSTTNYRAAFYLDPADFVVLGRATKIRVEALIVANDVASAINFSIDLRPITTPVGAATVVQGTVGSSIASSGTFTTPGANSTTRKVGTEIDFPTAGVYVLYVDLSGAMAASSSVLIRANLAVRHDSA